MRVSLLWQETNIEMSKGEHDVDLTTEVEKEGRRRETREKYVGISVRVYFQETILRVLRLLSQTQST